MIFINLLANRSEISPQKKLRMLAPTLGAVVISFVLGSCTTANSAKQTSDGMVSADSSGASDPSLKEIPEELRNAHQFDPALTLDPKVVKDSDFYQIKQAIEKNRANLEAAWKEQEAIEARVKAAMIAEKQRKDDIAKREEEERELKRKQSIDEFERTKEERAKYEADAERRVKKMPTISRDDELWNGLED